MNRIGQGDRATRPGLHAYHTDTTVQGAEMDGGHENVNVPRNSHVRPMTMEPRCSKVIFPKYPKKKQAEDTPRTAAMGKTGRKCLLF